MATLRADLYWSFRSPYSYLAMPRYRALIAEYDLEIALKPVYPLAVREPDFFERNHPNWLGYTMRDVMRLAQYHGVSMAPPRPDPIVQDIATRKIAKDQPYIYRLVRLGQAAARRGRGFAFADAAREAGLDLAEMDSEAEADAEALDAEVAANQVALEASGHWGVPTLVFEDEPFFGQDRIDLALWRMRAAGLTERA